MSFDALTISGVLAALVSTGFVVGVVRNNRLPSDSDPDQQFRSEARPDETRETGD
jgi:hypothetical protein